jgi:hypothetical protein
MHSFGRKGKHTKRFLVQWFHATRLKQVETKNQEALKA